MEITLENLQRAIAALRQCAKENEGKPTDTGKVVVSDLCTDVADFLERQIITDGKTNLKCVIEEIWHKGTDHPNNRHPYPVINPDTQEMAFAYYDQLFDHWEFDRNYNPGRNMLWMDIEKILPTQNE